MGRSCQFNRLPELQPEGVEHNQQTYWQVRTLLSSASRLSKFHRFMIPEERDTQDGDHESTRHDNKVPDLGTRLFGLADSV